MLNDADTLALLAARRPNHSLAQPFYTDSGVFELDMQRIFYREWLLAIPSCEIPKTGNYVTLRVGAYPVVIVRTATGSIRAYHNSCRHRGSRLCSAAKGSAPRLVCPYHQWTYDLDGRLLFARDMAADFDAGSHGLKPVHCRETGGLVFICLAERPPAFEAFAEAAQRYLAPQSLLETKVAFESTIVEKGNWKLVFENNRECYHCSGAHPELCRTLSDAPIVTTADGVDNDTDRHNARCEAAGLPSRFHIAPNHQWRFMRLPLIGTAESFTMDGRAAVQRTMGSIPFRDAGSLLLFHYPSSWNHFLSDHAIVFRILPLSPTETEVTTKWLVHKDAQEGVDYDLGRLTEIWLATNDSDRRIVEENQAGVLSPAYEPGPYSMRHEDGVIQFVEWYCRILESRLADRAMLAAV